ncbi:hypothetical protein AJ78_02724 [Emergomyces pasteurianus Ep9510]|uniref:NF-kappa-B inhibitor-like protein 1 n=1 Tax=Emergomyces pasteurianus Ep9510 TaxID=1447872 RepID=A0A1J9QMS6_9EURO|nr:hypothetical protein AJ78_02724 [Emergomyces pasteurianus Ep9510]
MDDEYSTAQRSKFRFKSKHDTSRSRSKSERLHDDDQDSAKSPSTYPRRYRRRHHHHHHRSSKRHKSSHHSPPPSAQPPELSPDAAFRESLFDALADDEGAAYWESVYGQPIHTYARPDGGGELEQMTDEEYAAYVRARMWEKTHEALFEERERKKREREKQKEEDRWRKGGEPQAFERMIDESLRRGQERKLKKRRADVWLDVWRKYLDSWEDLNARARAAAVTAASSTSSQYCPSADIANEKLRNLIFWPVESGKRRDITPEAVETFIRNAPMPTPTNTPAAGAGLGQRGKSQPHASDLLTVLKIERVRWHPDKMQRRYGALGMEEQLVKSATEVFQILDRIWVEERERGDKGR